MNHGFITVPDKPGIGVELNADAIKAHLKPGTEYFGKTDQWNDESSWDRTWS